MSCDLRRKKTHTSIDTLQIEMTHTTRHVTLRWNFKRKCRSYQLTFIFVFENVMWHFGFEVECQTQFVKHTHYSHHLFYCSKRIKLEKRVFLLLFPSFCCSKIEQSFCSSLVLLFRWVTIVLEVENVGDPLKNPQLVLVALWLTPIRQRHKKWMLNTNHFRHTYVTTWTIAYILLKFVTNWNLPTLKSFLWHWICPYFVSQLGFCFPWVYCTSKRSMFLVWLYVKEIWMHLNFFWQFATCASALCPHLRSP